MKNKLLILLLCLCIPFVTASCEKGQDKDGENNFRSQAEINTLTVKLAPENADANACGDNVTWRFDENTGTLYIEGSGAMWEYMELKEEKIEDRELVDDDIAVQLLPPWGEQIEEDEIKHIRIGEKITSVGSGAFAYYSDVKSIELPEGLKRIGHLNFNQASIDELTLPDSLEYMGHHLFAGCDLTRVTIPKNVSFIGNESFSGSELKSVEFKTSVPLYIGRACFFDCDIQKLYIPKDVYYIGDIAFSENRSLEDIEVDESNKDYCSVDGVLFNKEMTELLIYPGSKTNETYVIPDGVTIIRDYAFRLSDIVNLTMAETVREIGKYAFEGMFDLEEIKIPEGVTEIKRSTFARCGFSSVSLPASLVKIEKEGFNDHTRLKNLYYSGSEADWDKIEMDENVRIELESSYTTIHYNS